MHDEQLRLRTPQQLKRIFARRDAAEMTHVLLEAQRQGDAPQLKALVVETFAAWKKEPVLLADALHPVIGALPTQALSRSQWNVVAQGAEAAGNAALRTACLAHVEAAPS